MPTYEYRCPEGHDFEVFQRMSDPPQATCPACGAEAQRQLSAGAGFLFKGEGFYITDYRPDSYKKAAEAEKKANGDGATTGGDSSAPKAPKGKKAAPPSPPKPAGGTTGSKESGSGGRGGSDSGGGSGSGGGSSTSAPE